MISKSILFSYFLLIFLVSYNTRLSYADGPFGFHCGNTAYNPNSTSGSAYTENRKLLLSTLSSNASSTTSNGFYNFTAGQDPDSMVYGMFLCRGDVDADACGQCVANASGEILKKCWNQTTAFTAYGLCLLRYSNESIFSRVTEGVPFITLIVANATDPDQFNRVLNDAMIDIASRAANANDPSGKKFAVKEASYAPFQKDIHALGQCTPDLTSLDCENCLRDAIAYIPTYCASSPGCNVIFPSCFIRYELYSFYNSSSPAPEPARNPGPPPPPSPPSPPSPSNSPSSEGGGGISTRTVVAIVVPISIIVLFIMGFCIARRSKKTHDAISETTGATEILTIESLQYKLSEIQAATNNFAIGNRVGEGGFGPVYKGTLPNGQEIAVKRLSRSSAQGTEEFKNEIALVARLQHRNLVRLLGFCLEGEERILIYEFITNKSLDYFLFDSKKQQLLDWLRRYKIIGGIARGLLYLHEDSRLRIIHRDLKASNVLLDGNMNPKIADFGMARLFEVDQSEGNTSRIAGTFGYMAPEYALHGLFSVKSDVFSFGVLVLEIVSGKKNNQFYQTHGGDDLLSYAWRQWRDGTPLALMDPTMGDSYARNEVIKSIHVALLCVQDEIEQRPTMASVVLMLNSYSVTLPVPNPPAYFGRSRTQNLPIDQPESGTSTNTKLLPGPSVNEVSNTELYPR
ncbi:cysteine-rich receptor-like protein kinase 10 [Coffea eugenioides]|uniref:cysteine-rich receptor-like protein kinase 10 n=1 Tax=Coffea eugenioides TaxID=49369 RepID=UPI000F60B437|nr:cysteine-rich receptor-like protein kinase 10 [Coffea eugenioides]